MSDLAARIEALGPAKAARILQAVARQRLSRVLAQELTPDADLATDLAAAVDITPNAGASAGELAKASLLLLAADPAMTSVLDSMVEHPPAEDFAIDPVTLGVGVGRWSCCSRTSKSNGTRTGSGRSSSKRSRCPTPPLAGSSPRSAAGFGPGEGRQDGPRSVVPTLC